MLVHYCEALSAVGTGGNQVAIDLITKAAKITTTVNLGCRDWNIRTAGTILLKRGVLSLLTWSQVVIKLLNEKYERHLHRRVRNQPSSVNFIQPADEPQSWCFVSFNEGRAPAIHFRTVPKRRECGSISNAKASIYRW